MPLDPFVDIARRAWLTCPKCGHGSDCAQCRAGRTCDEHWQYLLANQGGLVHLQCPSCTHLWDYDARRSVCR